MNILFLKGFNNYFNRRAKIAFNEELQEYKADSYGGYVEFDDVNFNPNDGILTELIVGSENQIDNNKPLDWDTSGAPDYCICFEMIGNPQYENIVSRWFVLEIERTRSGQYRVALKRDVVVDYYDVIKTSPCFIEKGIVNDINNPLLYNKESMTYNQIKTTEIPLKDATGCGWIVGYVPKNLPAAGSLSNMETTILMEGEPPEYYEPEDLPFSVSPYASTYYKTLRTDKDIYTYLFVVYKENSASNNPAFVQVAYPINYSYGTNVSLTRYNPQGMQISVEPITTTYTVSSSTMPANIMRMQNMPYTSYSQYVGTSLSGGYKYSTDAPTTRAYNLIGNDTISFQSTIVPQVVSVQAGRTVNTKAFIDTALSLVNNYLSEDLMSYNGKMVKYTDNKFYQIKVYEYGNHYASIGAFKLQNVTNDGSYSIENITSDSSTLNTAFNTFMSNMNINYTGYSFNNSNHVLTVIPMKMYAIELVQTSTETLTLQDRAASDRNHTYDNSADLFAIPYGEIKFANDGVEFTTTANRGLGMARAIAARYSDHCYDLQLVPYCPSQTLVNTLAYYINMDEAFDLTLLNSSTYQIYTSGSADAGVVFWVSSSKGTFDISLDLSSKIDFNLSDALNHKIVNETEICRVASPNYSGQFEFSLAKNNGVSKFNVDYTYKPYSPYIHVNPDFKFIYGQDWDDARGLICGGDFSLNHITSYWQTYMNNNKNYQQIFDRQIQNMDVNNSIALEKQEFQATVGTITSTIGGVLAGGAAGATVGSAAGPWGALAGGVVGAIGGGLGSGLASAYGAEKDRDWLQRQQSEARSYAIDMYGYQLGNIQAMPYSIKGTDALTNNNKIWPIVEIYNSTATEVELLKEKIKYNGMTVMAIGKIEDYCTSDDFDIVFIKGQFIKLDNDKLCDDFHIADAIYQEINKGIYIPSGGL